ncbi:ABC transporter permease [Candidatus Bathyarchaeota archaeon]|nr:MAG: ABC transporter permease [Candidatus Bathyarchaeota archaeon]
MNIIEIFSFSFEALKERYVRATLTTLMVIMGASLIVALNGAGNGFKNFVDNQFSNLGANILIVSPKGDIDINEALADDLSEIEGVEDVILSVQQTASITSKGETQTSIVMGIDQNKLPLIFPTISFQSGTFVSETDNVGIILGNEISRSPSGDETSVAVGQTVKVSYTRYMNQQPVVFERTFIVRGILNYVGSGVIPIDQMAFISTSAAKRFFDRKNYDGLYVITKDPNLNDEVMRRMRHIYGNELTIISPQVISNVIYKISGGIALFIRIVAMVSLLVASVGIITMLHTSVMERVREIGLLKALGFTNRLVLAVFLCEALIIGTVGGGVGAIFGMALSYGMSWMLSKGISVELSSNGGGSLSIEIIPSFDVWNIVSTWILCIVLSVISGFYPSWRASCLNPVETLRRE